jgi:hypothetical protein
MIRCRGDFHQDAALCAISSGCVIKASPAATKEMRVRMAASQGFLTISFYQESNGTLHVFNLCKLKLQDLAVCYPADDPSCFVLAAQMRGKFYHEIYCYPPPNLINTWLEFFRGATTFLGRINLSDISEESVRV